MRRVMILNSSSDHRGTASVRAFVVAGGRSSRMGRDKALLPYGDVTLLEHAIGKVLAVTHDITILCGPTRRYEDFRRPVVTDAVCGVGPLGGLYSALFSASVDQRPRMLWLAVDMPLVPASLLTRLIEELDQADTAMARTQNGLEPLCAAFRTEPALRAVRSALLRGQLKLTAALEGLSLASVIADVASFANINSPADYEGMSPL